MILYLDASALVKRYVDEDGTDAVLEAMSPDSVWSMCRIGYVETVRAVARAAEPAELERMKREWPLIDVIEVGAGLVEQAAQLAVSTGLRSLDAMHLAAALSLPSEDLVFATWDGALHRAARERSLRTLPTSLD
ncbi:MAG TPA: type II toxin-antitoxin system VapC family toxin [Solirubrobacterales bacterium]|nr:type II toxin-antitoxin system VapC family toxin [Solirubrobacterales bacterium]